MRHTRTGTGTGGEAQTSFSPSMGIKWEGVMGEPAMNLERRYTYKDYLEWHQDERWELIHGEPFGMAAPSTAHQDWVLEVGSQLKSKLRGKPCKPYIAPVDLL